MDLKKVFVIYDEGRYTREDIIKDIREEKFKAEFCIPNESDGLSYYIMLSKADEVWLWGNVIGTPYYRYAKKNGKDIWDMTK